MKIATAVAPEWQGLDTLPRGHKCLLLTSGGVAVVGCLSSSLSGYVAWSPLPKVPSHIKERIYGREVVGEAFERDLMPD